MQINGMNFSVGADPEVFIKNKDGFVSAFGMVPGDKMQPSKVEKGAVQVDGMALEFNIDPAEDEAQFEDNITSVMAQLKDMIPEHDFDENCTVSFTKEFLLGQHPLAVLLGCEPDFNAYTMDENRKPSHRSLIRTAGGHVHVGGFFTDNPFNSTHFSDSARLTRLLDETLGLPSLLWDKDAQRRTLYGAPGAFRPKNYGMEYRTLSNAWVFSPKLRSFVFKGVERALERMFDSSYEPPEFVRNLIISSNTESADFNNHEDVKFAKQFLEA